MKPCPVRPSSGSQLAEFVRWAEAEIRALQPIPTPGTLTGRGPNGSFRVPIESPAMQSEGLAILTTIREGLDAVECTDSNGNTVYCLKPPGLRCDGRTAYGVVGMAYGLDTGTVPNWMAYKARVELEQYSSYTNAFRAIRRIKTANSGTYGDNSTDTGAVFYHIAPFYTEIASGGSVTGTTLFAAPTESTGLSSSTLALGGSDVHATFTDITPRAWEPMNIFVNNVQITGPDAFGHEKAVFDSTGGSVFP